MNAGFDRLTEAVGAALGKALPFLHYEAVNKAARVAASAAVEFERAERADVDEITPWRKGWGAGANWQRRRVAELLAGLARGEGHAATYLAALMKGDTPDVAAQRVIEAARRADGNEKVQLDEPLVRDTWGPDGFTTQVLDDDGRAQHEWNEWTSRREGLNTPGCRCGHNGMGIEWHAPDCLAARYALVVAARDWFLAVHAHTATRQRLAHLLGEHFAPDDGDIVKAVERLVGFAAKAVREVPVPARGDAVEAWIKAARDAWMSDDGDTRAKPWDVLDSLLDDYRHRADTGTPLDQPAQEGRQS